VFIESEYEYYEYYKIVKYNSAVFLQSSCRIALHIRQYCFKNKLKTYLFNKAFNVQ